MLTLLSYIFNWRCIDILSRSHWRYLYSSISNTLSSNELLIEIWLCVWLLDSFDIRFILSQSTNNIKVFSLDHMIFFWFQDLFLFSLLQIQFLLDIKRSLRTTSHLILRNLLGTHKVWAILVKVVFRFKGNNGTFFVIILIILLLIKTFILLLSSSFTSLWLFNLRLCFFCVILRSIDSLRHSHYQFLRCRFLWIVLNIFN